MENCTQNRKREAENQLDTERDIKIFNLEKESDDNDSTRLVTWHYFYLYCFN